jgi:hypothetical protein
VPVVGRELFIQPNGQYALWSTVVDDFLGLNLSLQEVKDFIMMDRYSRISHYTRMLETADDPDQIQRIIGLEQEMLDEEFDAYYKRQMKDQDLALNIALLACLHGVDVAKERIDEMGGTYEEYERIINQALEEKEETIYGS